MAINRLHISHQYYKWNTNTVLISSNNINSLLNSSEEYNCHASVEDIQFENINQLVSKAKEIYLVDLSENIIEHYPNSFLLYGRLLHELYRNTDKVKTPIPSVTDRITFNKMYPRVNDNTVLWTAGCSVTFGSGVADTERYVYLLSQELSLPEVILARAGSSISFASDSILRADIRAGDIVVWGITSPGRIEVAQDYNLVAQVIDKYMRLPKEKQYWNLDYFSSSTMVLEQIRQVYQVINFCDKIDAEIYIANILDISWIPMVLKDFKTFVDFTKDKSSICGSSAAFLDLGTDNKHPGPAQHREYAGKLLNLIKENNHG